ncbi:MAG: GWxTD domain-containing protein [Thermoanaerobaculia bacterium]
MAVVAVAVWAACGSGGAEAPRRPSELVNFQLGPEHSHWLVGPVARMATPGEVEEYLALAGDFAAIDFIQAFWRRRDPAPEEPGNPVRRTFERRVREADRLYSEAGVLGRRTPRGTVYVLYGEPESVEFEIAPDGPPPIEVWKYPANAPPGLDGERPERFYRFRKQGDLTRRYQPGAPRRPRPPGPGAA